MTQTDRTSVRSVSYMKKISRRFCATYEISLVVDEDFSRCSLFTRPTKSNGRHIKESPQTQPINNNCVSARLGTLKYDSCRRAVGEFPRKESYAGDITTKWLSVFVHSTRNNKKNSDDKKIYILYPRVLADGCLDDAYGTEKVLLSFV